MSEAFSGGCQCGAVRYRAAELRDNPHVCYCRMCQKAVGNLFAALVGVTRENLIWTRGTPAVFRSSAQVERGFCHDCGTPLFYKHDDGVGYGMTIGSFDEPHRIALRYQMGLEGRHPSIPGLNQVEMMGTTEEADGVEPVAAIKASNRQHPDHDTAVWPLPH